MCVIMVQNISSKNSGKIGNRLNNLKKPVDFRGAKKVFAPSSLAGHRPKNPIATRVMGTITAAAVAGAILLGASDAKAAQVSSIIPPAISLAPLKPRIFYMSPPPYFTQFSEEESISGLLRDKAQQKKGPKAGTLGEIELLDDETYMVPMGSANKLKISLDSKNERILFKGLVYVPLGDGTSLFRSIGILAMNYGKLGLKNPVLFVRDGHTIRVGLIDSSIRQFVEIQMRKTELNPETAETTIFHEPNLEGIHALLSMMPQYVDNGAEAFPLFKMVFSDGKKVLAHKMAEYNAEGHKESLGKMTDEFIKIHLAVFNNMLCNIEKHTEGMPQEKKMELTNALESFILAYMLRPYAVWERGNSSFPDELLLQLDELTASPDFSLEKLRAFAWKNNLTREYNYHLKGIRDYLNTAKETVSPP